MTYGRIIISEYYLEKKTIQPVESIGGVAGGNYNPLLSYFLLMMDISVVL